MASSANLTFSIWELNVGKPSRADPGDAQLGLLVGRLQTAKLGKRVGLTGISGLEMIWRIRPSRPGTHTQRQRLCNDFPEIYASIDQRF